VDVEVAATAGVVGATDARVAGVADDLDPGLHAWLVCQRVPVAREAVLGARQVQVEVAVVAAVAGAVAATAAAVAGEAAALVADEGAPVAVVMDRHDDGVSSLLVVSLWWLLWLEMDVSFGLRNKPFKDKELKRPHVDEHTLALFNPSSTYYI
jgi:hypothetical protein